MNKNLNNTGKTEHEVIQLYEYYSIELYMNRNRSN